MDGIRKRHLLEVMVQAVRAMIAPTATMLPHRDIVASRFAMTL